MLTIRPYVAIYIGVDSYIKDLVEEALVKWCYCEDKNCKCIAFPLYA